MCGITGLVNLSVSKSFSNELNSSLIYLNHRGKDDRGVWQDERIYLGHTRLSILDLSLMGHQPMSYQNERFWIVFNGEIYNYLELRKELISLGHHFNSQTDTEILLVAYARWGINCLSKFRGMFAFAIWDREQKTLFLARDRIGEKPLYYAYSQDKFYFASELKALISLLPNIPSLDAASIDLYLHYQYVPEPRTPLANINKLQAAHYILLKCEELKTSFTGLNVVPKNYWDLRKIATITGDPISLIKQELNASIELTLRSDVPIGIALSGGIDSSAIAALASTKYNETLHAFSIGYPNRPSYDEREQARELAQLLKLPFKEFELRTQDLVDFFPSLIAANDDPIADIAAYGHYAVMRLASEHGMKVMLSGIGGDELFWGYEWTKRAVSLTCQKHKFISSWQSSKFVLGFLSTLLLSLQKTTHNEFFYRLTCSNKLPKYIRKFFNQLLELSLLDPEYPQQAIYQNLISDFRLYQNTSKFIYTKSFSDQIPYRNAYSPFQLKDISLPNLPVQICEILFDTWLTSNCLALGDRLSMASSVELRLPLLDYKLIELVIGLRQSYPDHDLDSKAWLKSALDGVVPQKILSRKKQGFQPPVNEWMNAIISKYQHCLLGGYLVSLNILEKSYLSQMIDRFNKRGHYRFILYKILVLETWYRKVVIECHQP